MARWSGGSPCWRARPTCSTPRSTFQALQEVANLAIDVLADWCTVDLLTEGQQIHRAAVAHRDPAMVARAQELQRKYPQDTNDPAFRHLLASREPIFVEHFDDDMLTALAKDLEQREVAREFHISSFLVVPSRRGQGHRHHQPHRHPWTPLDPEDVELAVDLGRRSGAAVEKTRLYAELRETAQVLQASLLPATLPEVPGATLSAHYRSGTEGLQIGGDFYDVFRTGPDRWWVALGDVCGKARPRRHSRQRCATGARRRPGHHRPRRGPAPAQRRAPRPGGGGSAHHLGAGDLPGRSRAAGGQRGGHTDRPVRRLRRPPGAAALLARARGERRAQ